MPCQLKHFPTRTVVFVVKNNETKTTDFIFNTRHKIDCVIIYKTHETIQFLKPFVGPFYVK